MKHGRSLARRIAEYPERKSRMKVHWASLAVGAVFAAAGFAALYAALRRMLCQALDKRQMAAEQQIAALAAKVKALEARMAELNSLDDAGDARNEGASIAAAAASASAPGRGRVQPEMLAVITSAATAFLGKNARVRSARLIPAAQETVSPWSQQGRVVVQTSHNLRAHG